MLISYDPSVKGRLRVSRVYVVTHNDAVSYAASKTVELKPDDNIYCLPDVSIPRFKLQGPSEKHGFKVVKNIDKADYIFIGPRSKGKSLSNLSNKQVEYSRCYVMPDIASARIFSNAVDPASPIYAPDFVNCICDNPKIEYIMNERDASEYRQYIYDETQSYIWFRYNYTRENFISLAQPSLYNKLRSENHLTQLISDQSIVITNQKYEELQRMFNSDSDDNIVLAMEIMANSNYPESILNNYFLLHQNSYKIRRSRASTHKNFKSLLNFFNTELSYLTGSFSTSKLEGLTEVLIRHNKFTQEARDRMLEMFISSNYTFRGKYYNNEMRPNEDLKYDE